MRAFLLLACVTLSARPVAAAADCPDVPGDYAPGSLDTGTDPPTFTPEGDGEVTVADVTALVNVVLDRAQIAGGSTEVMLRGTVGPSGIVQSGQGFSVSFTPAGSGGSPLPGNVSVSQSSTLLQAAAGQSPDFQNQLSPGQFLMIDGRFVKVAIINSSTSATLAEQYPGPSQASTPAVRGMTLYNRYAVTFDTPFGNTPTVVVSARGHMPSAAETPAFNVAQLDDNAEGGAVDTTGFRVLLVQAPFAPYLPGGTADIDFIAIGPKP